MPKAYMIFTEDIHDAEKMNEYSAKAVPTLFASGAKVLAVSPSPEVLEGEWHGPQTVVLEFESAEAAKAWYESDAYAAAKPMRLEAANCNAVIVPGFEMPGG